MSEWATVLLGEIAELTAGNPAPQERVAFTEHGRPFVRMQDVGRHHHTDNLIETRDRIDPGWSGAGRLRLFPKNSLLVPKSGASINLNHRALLGIDAYVVSHLAVVVPDREKVDPRYLFWWSVTYDPRQQAQVTSLPSLPLSILRKATVPLPPLLEQRRIVDVLTRADGIRGLRREARDKARQLIPALFVEMFGDPVTNTKRWPVSFVGDLLRACDYGTSKKASTERIGTPVLRMGNVTTDGDLALDDLKYMDLENGEFAKYRLEAGDLLFNRTNSKELVGKTGIWDGRFDAVPASYFIRLRVDPAKADPWFVWAFFNTRHMKRRLFDTARGAIGQSNINAKEVKAFPVPLPPIDLQHAFAERVADVQALIAQQDRMAEASEELTQALMAKVFGGETVGARAVA